MKTRKPRESAVERWGKRITRPDLYQLANHNNVIVHGDVVYSYGTHYELARTLRDERGNATAVIVNGDERPSVSTGRHMADVRGIVRRHAGDVPFAMIPYTALRAAGIDIDSIVILDCEPEGWQYSLTTAHKAPETAEQMPVHKVEWGDPYADGRSAFGRFHDAYVAEYGEDRDRDHWIAHMEAAPTLLAVKDERGDWQEIRQTEDGRYQWHRTRHWLGDALIAARVRGSRRRVKWMSGFDRNEPRPLYFLCQLPATTATTIAEGLESLKPDTVRMGEAMGRVCERQGDIFGIPMPGLTLADLRRDGGTMVRRSDVRRPVLAARKCAALYERLVQAEDVRFRADDYVKLREARRKAVFGNLPWGTPDPIGRGRGFAWNAPVAREAEARAEAVAAHRRDKWEALLTARAEAVTGPDAATISLLGTAHTATHVVTMPDGTQYARGTMYHDPDLMGEDRDRDHVARKMGDGKTWHLIQKNTVPVAKRPSVAEPRRLSRW